MSNLSVQPERFSFSNDVIGGITTFLTMSYIVVVNPAILSTEGTGLSFSGVMMATVVLAASMTFLMGMYAKLPFAVAPGMGINAFFAFSLLLGQKIPWPQALGIIFWAGVAFLLLSFTPARTKIAEAIPENIRHAAACGIGFFLTFIGLKNIGLVVANPVTFVTIGYIDGKVLLGLCGLLIAGVLSARKSRFALLLPIVAVTVAAALLGYIAQPQSYVSKPDFSSTFFKLDIWGALKLAYVPAIIVILFTDLFDSISTFVGVSSATGLVDAEGKPLRLKQGLIVDAWATLTAGLLGTSSGTAFIESAAGIEAGARTGRASIVTALCFLPCLFLAPLAAMVPAYATGPILVMVGALMFRSVLKLKLTLIEDVLPAFLTLILIPLTFSITQGLLWGFLSHTFLYVLKGRAKDLSVTMWILALASLLLVIVENRI